MLHITNGTSVSLRESGLEGEVLAWNDVLHEGPVPEGLSLAELSRLRGTFLDSIWPGQYSAVDALSRRDALLSRHQELALWFEHDLFDQLQLIQILDFLRGSKAHVDLICTDEYLGPLTGSQLAALWPRRHTVTQAEIDLASAAWRAFRSPDPTGIEDLLSRDTSALPYLAGALVRHLQQFPAVENGLSRTEQQILEAVEAGYSTFHSLFRADQQREERIFMGDATLQRYVDELVACRHPLLRKETAYEVTDTGREVLMGRADHVHMNGIDRWLGGVHLQGNEARWRWDERARQLVVH